VLRACAEAVEQLAIEKNAQTSGVDIAVLLDLEQAGWCQKVPIAGTNEEGYPRPSFMKFKEGKYCTRIPLSRASMETC
jgi:hypothetical protein